MRKTTLIWLIVAASLLMLGIIIFGGVMTVLKWDFAKLSTTKYETNTHQIDGNYSGISVVSDTADITLLPSEDGTTSVVCYEDSKQKHEVGVKDGTLTVERKNNKKWYDYIGINFGSAKITVYLPEGEYSSLTVKESTGDIEVSKEFGFESIDISTSTGNVKSLACAKNSIKISTSTGAIDVEGVSAGALDLSVSTGKVTVLDVSAERDISIKVSTGKASLSGVMCKSLTSSGSTGDISMKNVIASEKLSIERSTGDVKFDGSDAAEIFVQTDTGDVSGTLLSEKVFITESDTGNINVPSSITGGRCEIKTDTGDIKISIVSE